MSKHEPPPFTPTPRSLPKAYAFLSVFFALLQLRLITILLTKPIVRSLEVAESVVHGHAPWRVFQSRVLSPWILEGMSRLVGTYSAAFDLFSVACLAASAWLTPELTRRLGDPRRPPMAAFLVFVLGFTLLVIGNWLYPWDLLGLLLFTIFQYLALRRASWKQVAPLFAIAILNSETALAMAGWLVLDPIVRRMASGRDRARAAKLDVRTLAVGAFLLAGGAVLVEGLRNALLLGPPTMTPSSPLTTPGQNANFALVENLYRIGLSVIPRPAQGYPILIPAFLVLVVILAVRLARTDFARQGANAIVAIGMAVSFLLFGEIFESRVLMPLIPFVAMNSWAILIGESKNGGDL